jgi:acetylornithine/LysW-gamma-L-lysine aminotransferase
LGAWLLEELRGLDHPAIREVRGLGLIVGIQLRSRVTPVLKNLQDRGVLALPAGFNVLRLLPPLIITRAELQQVVNAIAESLDE